MWPMNGERPIGCLPDADAKSELYSYHHPTIDSNSPAFSVARIFRTRDVYQIRRQAQNGPAIFMHILDERRTYMPHMPLGYK